MAAISTVLDQIYASAWPLSDRRRFVAPAIRRAIGGSTVQLHVCQPETKEEPIDKLEEVLCAVQLHGRVAEYLRGENLSSERKANLLQACCPHLQAQQSQEYSSAC